MIFGQYIHFLYYQKIVGLYAAFNPFKLSDAKWLHFKAYSAMV